MNRWLLGLLCVGMGFTAQAQTVQWASSVSEFSSQKSAKANSAAKIVGSPNAMPQGGSNLNAWEAGETKSEFIRVRFGTPTPIEKVVVLENYMPGSITKITAVDDQGKEYSLPLPSTGVPAEPSRVLEVVVPKTSYKVSSIRLDLNALLVADNPQIDAIGIMEKAGPLSFIVSVPSLVLTASAERLSDEINTIYPEDAPLVSFDEKTLYFSRGLHPDNIGGVSDIEDIWISRQQPDGSWGKPKNAGPPVNNKDANFIFSETKQGTNVLLGNVYAEGVMKEGASMARKLPNGSFSNPKPLIIKNDQNLNDQVDYVLSARGDILIIAEERESSLGNRDLHVSFLQPDSTWSEPVNLGPNVNSASDEFAPFLAPDDRSLFFSTEGRPGYGDVDIYVVNRQGDGWDQWSEPMNLGPYINGPDRDSYFSVPARGDYAYFTKVAKGTKETDIYRIKFPKNLDSRPKFITPENSTSVVPAPAASTTQPSVTQTPQAEATPSKEAEPTSANATETAKPGKGSSKKGKGTKSGSMEEPVALTEVQFEVVQFDFSKAEINDANYPELAKVAAYMKEHPGAVIRVAGHTDAVGNSAYNQKLSQARAKAVRDYLVSQGVSANSLKRKGYGESRPKADNASEEGRAANRRVEFVLLKL